jgi:hypothetical protein
MPTVDDISHQIAEGGDLDQIRLGLAELIGEQLRAFNDSGSLGYWERRHFGSAVASLAMDLRSAPGSRFWLRLCLQDIVHALIPADRRDEDYTPKNPQAEAITFDQLLRALRTVGG